MENQYAQDNDKRLNKMDRMLSSHTTAIEGLSEGIGNILRKLDTSSRVNWGWITGGLLLVCTIGMLALRPPYDTDVRHDDMFKLVFQELKESNKALAETTSRLWSNVKADEKDTEDFNRRVDRLEVQMLRFAEMVGKMKERDRLQSLRRRPNR